MTDAVQMQTDESLVSNVITSMGLREVHVLRFGKSTNDYAWKERWAQAVCPDHAREFLTWRVSMDTDKSLNYYHLYLWWNARELVEFARSWRDCPLRYGVLWYVPKGVGETISFSVDVAATLYRQKMGRKPSTAWLRSEPVSKRAEVQTQEGVVRVITGTTWVPERYIVVGRPREEWDPEFKGGRYE